MNNIEDIKDPRIDQIYIHALKHKHKLVYSREGDQTIVWAYDPKYSAPTGEPDSIRGSSIWVRFR